MPTGADIKRYRKVLKLGQREFAALLGVSQPSLSLAESGKVGVSEALQQKLIAVFNKPGHSPTYDDFCRTLEEQRRSGQTLVGNPSVTYVTVPVWLWEEGFDLGAPPEVVESRGVVTVRTASTEVIAFEMPAGASFWVAREVLVFARTGVDKCRTGDLTLVQLKSVNAKLPNTFIAVVHYDETGRHRKLQFEPCNPSHTAFTPDLEQVEGVLRCICRVRYTD